MSGRRCSNCGRTVNGHVGQCGDKCTMPKLLDISFHENAEEGLLDHEADKQDQAASARHIDVNPQAMMSELSKQVLDLTLCVKHLTVEVGKIDVQPSRQDPDNLQRHTTPDRNPAISSASCRYLSNGEKVSEATYNKAVSGEFINLVELLSYDDQNEYETSVIDGTLQIKPKKSKKALDSFLSWLQAWNNFELLLMSVKPHLYIKLLAYRNFIQNADKKYQWSAIYSYDLHFRTELARNRSFEYGKPITDLVVTLLDATAIKNNVSRCFRCRSTSHVVQECPFPATYTLEANPKTPKKITQNSWVHQGREGCNNFNQGRCTYAGCRRAHVCQACRGPKPFTECPCNTNKIPV